MPGRILQLLCGGTLGKFNHLPQTNMKTQFFKWLDEEQEAYEKIQKAADEKDDVHEYNRATEKIDDIEQIKMLLHHL